MRKPKVIGVLSNSSLLFSAVISKKSQLIYFTVCFYCGSLICMLISLNWPSKAYVWGTVNTTHTPHILLSQNLFPMNKYPQTTKAMMGQAEGNNSGGKRALELDLQVRHAPQRKKIKETREETKLPGPTIGNP